MFKKAAFYAKLASKLMKNELVDNEDFRNEYNRVSRTYTHWLNEMGPFTDKIIDLDYVQVEGKPKILDFACGTGYISKRILEKNIDCEITAVDYSEKMLESLKELKDSRVKVIHSDGMDFLKSTNEKYHVIYLGWALPYFRYKELFKLFSNILKPNGVVKIITNVQGTLSGVEDIFIKVMFNNQKQIVKPMDIRFNLPKGKEGLVKWFNQYGFKEIEVKEGEKIIAFDEAEQLLKWLEETGALAGTMSIFEDYDLIKDNLIEEIKKTKYYKGKYEINHRFVYGTFNKRGSRIELK